jgi:hypothetical protein
MKPLELINVKKTIVSWLVRNYSYNWTWKLVEDNYSLRSPEVQQTIEIEKL